MIWRPTSYGFSKGRDKVVAVIGKGDDSLLPRKVLCELGQEDSFNHFSTLPGLQFNDRL